MPGEPLEVHGHASRRLLDSPVDREVQDYVVAEPPVAHVHFIKPVPGPPVDFETQGIIPGGSEPWPQLNIVSHCLLPPSNVHSMTRPAAASEDDSAASSSNLGYPPAGIQSPTLNASRAR